MRITDLNTLVTASLYPVPANKLLLEISFLQAMLVVVEEVEVGVDLVIWC